MMETLGALELVLRDRRARRPEGSYTAELLADPERVQRKLLEEAFEVCLELGRQPVDQARVAEEAADLLYHLLVGLVGAEVELSAVAAVLEQRRT